MQAGRGFSQVPATCQQFAYGARPSGDTNGTAAGGSLRAGVQLDVGQWYIEPSRSRQVGNFSGDQL